MILLNGFHKTPLRFSLAEMKVTATQSCNFSIKVVSVRSNVNATYIKGSSLCSIKETARNAHCCPHVGGTYGKVPEHSAVNFMVMHAVRACLNIPAYFI